MSKYYEIVIFTTATQSYADWVLNEIDPNHYISHRLYRQHLYSNDSGLGIVKVTIDPRLGFEVPGKRYEKNYHN